MCLVLQCFLSLVFCHGVEKGCIGKNWVKTILIAPATNTISERSFSTLKRFKTSIRSTMASSRLNHLLMVHVYKEELDEINMKLIVNKFIKVKEFRIASFELH